MKFRPSFTLILLASLLAALLGLVVPLQVAHASSTWTNTASLSVTRVFHTETLLANGKVLVAGGFSTNGTSGTPLASAELYDPSTSSWTLTGSLNVARGDHTATLLSNGKVLVAGGEDISTSTPLASAELYDPSTGSWTLTGSLNMARTASTATLLSNGQVLVAGGFGNIGGSLHLASAELYDPSTSSWTLTGSLSVGRAGHKATLLSNGQVLVAGGVGNSDTILASAELYDPSTSSWSSTASMSVARFAHTATLLPNGKVLVAGGDNSSGFLSSAELYDPSTSSWSSTASMSVVRFLPTATLLSNGKVLVAGGIDTSSTLTSAELYDPSTSSWSSTASMNVARGNYPAILLSNGQVLVVGGSTFNNISLASAELFSLDTTAPVLSLPGTITMNATSPAGAVVTYPFSATDPDDLSSQLTINCTPASGSTFPIGTTTVNCTASDPAGNSSSGSFQVIVNDTDLGLTNLPTNMTVNATSPQGATATYTTPTVVDEDSPLLTASCTPTSGSTFAIGTTTVTCTASDSDDTPSSVSQSFTVTVRDTDLGLSNLPANITTNATSPQGKTVTYTPPTAVDESGDSPGPTVNCTPTSGSTFAIGTTTVTCTASDSDDTPSSVSQSFTVTVQGATAQVNDLITTVQGLPIASGLKASLLTQLQSVLADLQANNTAQACSDLTSFINHVKAQSGKGLTTDQANQLIAAATQIKAVLGC